MFNEFDPVKANLTNYWPFDGNLIDVVGGKHMTIGQNASFSSDNNGNTNSSLDLNNGYVKAPDGIYFNGDFTITVWVMPRKFTNGSRLLDFAILNSNGT